jgi:hypothetical protein
LTSTGGTYGFSYTDASQSWTPDELVGYFFEFTSGAMNGQVCPIVANTATTVRTGCAFSNASPGDTYVIRTTSSNFTTTGTWNIFGFTGIATDAVILQDLGLLKSGSSANLLVVASNVGGTRFNRCRIIGGPTGIVGQLNARATLDRSFVQATGGSSIAITSTMGSAPPALLSYTNSAARSTGTGYAIGIFALSRTSSTNFYGIAQGNPPNGGVVFVRVNSDVYIGYPFRFAVLCDSTTNIGVRVGDSTLLNSSGTLLASLVTEGCGVGLDLDSLSTSAILDASSFTNSTTAISVKSGGSLKLTSAPAFTGVTNELQVDGENFTYGFLNGLSPSVITGPYGSRIFK